MSHEILKFKLSKSALTTKKRNKKPKELKVTTYGNSNLKII